MKPSIDHTKHWDTIYNTKEDEQLGWYEDRPEATLSLIYKCHLRPEATILNVGTGTSILIDHLLEKGFKNIIANDLSNVALQKLAERISKKYNYHLQYVVDDLTKPKDLLQLKQVDLWIDRAVLHFFLSKEEQDAYFDTVRTLVLKGGYVLIAVFSLEGAEKCSGLQLQRFNTEMVQTRLGPDFKLIEAFKHVYINPSGGKRPYIYTLFQKQ